MHQYVRFMFTNTTADVRTDTHSTCGGCCTYLPIGKTVVDGDKWVDANGDKDADAGELLVYQLLVVNVGTVTLDSIILTDGSVTSGGVSCEPAIPDFLMPGEGFECHSTYTVSRACGLQMPDA